MNRTTVERNSAKILQQLTSPDFDPTQPVVLDEDVAIKSSRTAETMVKILRYENRIVTIETSGKEKGILVLADSYYPGWKAFVDGREEVMRRANLFFRAIPVPAGDSPLSFAMSRVHLQLGSQFLQRFLLLAL